MQLEAPNAFADRLSHFVVNAPHTPTAPHPYLPFRPSGSLRATIAPLSKASSKSMICRPDSNGKLPMTVTEKLQFILVRMCLAFAPSLLVDIPIVISSFLAPTGTMVASPTDANAPPAVFDMDSKRILCIIWTVLSFAALFSMWTSTRCKI